MSGTLERFAVPVTFENIVRTMLEFHDASSMLIIELVRDETFPDDAPIDECAKAVAAWTLRDGELRQLPSLPGKRSSWSRAWLEVAVTGTNTFYYGIMFGPMAGHGNTVTVDENGHPTFQRNWVS